ncbi:MAG: type II toxin-antitoxin system ParD family antitoxin [Jaaginema sp. PMC 1079.18]|nr:type II toxin-antitoxin system ParD family antitoxin [Jaaginema sp. PMC 1080.18]MEC4851858.1 type II toxin-antitoxin system ParD family antitoxin [Jaaginema sp. PMC 1079.18]MEC4867678.1 type II toxin-antitoxin system ParD family antitoxin [Jaaginema sp. PMC 1078.18]
MQISLNSEHEAFIQTQLAQGNYQSADELLSQALNLLKQQKDYEQWLNETCQKIADGVTALERGDAIEGDVVITKLRDRLYGNDIS